MQAGIEYVQEDEIFQAKYLQNPADKKSVTEKTMMI